MGSSNETQTAATFHFQCSCGADGDLTLQKADGYKTFGCPEGCGNTYVPYQGPLRWMLRCVVERVFRSEGEAMA